MKQIYKKLLAAVLGVSMLLSMVGCGQNDTSDQTQTGGENEAKVLTIVTAKELDSLTTLTMNKENNIACGLVYETLVAYEDGEIVPELANRRSSVWRSSSPRSDSTCLRTESPPTPRRRWT